MKKLAAMLLAMAMVLSLAACSEKTPELDAFDIYTQVKEQNKAAKSSEMTMTMDVKIGMPAAAGEEAAPAEGEEAAPAEGEEAAPAEGEAAPAEGEEAAPAEGEAAPAEGEEAAPAEGEEAAPAEGEEAAPAEGEEMTELMAMSMTGTVQTVMKSETDLDMAMNMTMSVLGQSVPMEMYYTEGYMYQNAMGTKTKTATPIEDAMAQANLIENADFVREDVKDMSVTDVEGGKEVALTFDGARMNTIMDDMMGVMGNMLGEMEGLNMTFSDIQFKMLVDKDMKPVTQEMVFSVDMAIEGEMVRISYVALIENIVLDGIEAIELPADLADYVDVTPEGAAPAEGEAAPAEGEAAPAEGEAAPAEGEAAPAEGEAAPAEGEAAPAEGEAAPESSKAA